jgi:hypothetical protein
VQAHAEHCRSLGHRKQHKGGAGFTAIVPTLGPDLHPHVQLMTRIVPVLSIRPTPPHGDHALIQGPRDGLSAASFSLLPPSPPTNRPPQRLQSQTICGEMECALLGETFRRCSCGYGTGRGINGREQGCKCGAMRCDARYSQRRASGRTPPPPFAPRVTGQEARYVRRCCTRQQGALSIYGERVQLDLMGLV